jgi:hypothetical protein
MRTVTAFFIHHSKQSDIELTRRELATAVSVEILKQLCDRTRRVREPRVIVMNMDLFNISSGACHLISRKLLIFKLLWEKSCRGVSLLTQVFPVLYISTYIHVLFLFENALVKSVKAAHLFVSLALVLIMRHSPTVASSYEAEFDIVPKTAQIFNKVSVEQVT